MQPAELKFIGIVRGDIYSRQDAPKNYTESQRTGILEIFPEFREGLDGIEPGQTIVVLFWLHQAERDILKVYPRGDRSRGLRGVFATRSPFRPNPIALSELQVVGMTTDGLAVIGLDVLDATPIIDIKKQVGR